MITMFCGILQLLRKNRKCFRNDTMKSKQKNDYTLIFIRIPEILFIFKVFYLRVIYIITVAAILMGGNCSNTVFKETKKPQKVDPRYAGHYKENISIKLWNSRQPTDAFDYSDKQNHMKHEAKLTEIDNQALFDSKKGFIKKFLKSFSDEVYTISGKEFKEQHKKYNFRMQKIGKLSCVKFQSYENTQILRRIQNNWQLLIEQQQLVLGNYYMKAKRVFTIQQLFKFKKEQTQLKELAQRISRDFEAQCKFCCEKAEPNNPLIHPCKCTGSINSVHEQCLNSWIFGSTLNNLRKKIDKSKNISKFLIKKPRCQICHESYQIFIMNQLTNIINPDLSRLYKSRSKIRQLSAQSQTQQKYVLFQCCPKKNRINLNQARNYVCFRFDSNQSQFSLGSSKNSDFVIEENKISKTHARIGMKNNSLVVKDMESRFGTAIIYDSNVLKPQESYQIGDLYLKFELNYEPVSIPVRASSRDSKIKETMSYRSSLHKNVHRKPRNLRASMN